MFAVGDLGSDLFSEMDNISSKGSFGGEHIHFIISFKHYSSVTCCSILFSPRATTHIVLLGVFPGDPFGFFYGGCIEPRSSFLYLLWDISALIFCVLIFCSIASMTAL